MTDEFPGDIYAGLAGIELEVESFDFGEGVILQRTYAHLMSHFLMAFKPAPPKGPHPPPWRAASGSFGFDVKASLLIPAAIEGLCGSKFDVAKMIVFLLRIGINPAIRVPVVASHSYSDIRDGHDKDVHLTPFEISPRCIALSVDAGNVTADSLVWVKDRWRVALQLFRDSSEFSLAVDALDSGQFVHNSALALVSLWAALEGLFSPSTSELKFRVSALIASYLEPPGFERAALQKSVAKLYDRRSAAAHGSPKHDDDDLLNTFLLLRRALMAIIDHGRVPRKDYLERLLFGCVDDG